MEQLKQELDRKRSFVRSVSHEIRTPLNTVFLGLKLLYEELEKKAEKKDTLEIISDLQRSSDTAVSILDDLLAYEKLEAGILKTEFHPLQIKKLCDETTKSFILQVTDIIIYGMFVFVFVNICFSQAKEADIKLSIVYCPESVLDLSTAYILGDAAKLGQVIRNLMSNALKFTSRGGKVTMLVNSYPEQNVQGSASTRCPEGVRSARLRIQVIDTGPGISKVRI